MSLASGKATFDRLKLACRGNVNASRIVQLDDDAMTTCGLSRQKLRYVRQLAQDVQARRFSVAGLARLSDDEARKKITSRLGLGDWTADVYLMMALGREDILPVGDLALVTGLEEIDGMTYRDGKHTTANVIARAEIWRPNRSLGTKIVWAHYLDRRRK